MQDRKVVLTSTTDATIDFLCCRDCAAVDPLACPSYVPSVLRTYYFHFSSFSVFLNYSLSDFMGQCGAIKIPTRVSERKRTRTNIVRMRDAGLFFEFWSTICTLVEFFFDGQSE
jgi:hypothetical protein